MRRRTTATRPTHGELRVFVVGGGPRFLSGISYYTSRLIVELSERYQVSGVLARRLVPKRLYPGSRRVGANLTASSYPSGTPVIECLDWYWGIGLVRALRFLKRQQPDVIILQWWTGALLHTYLVLALAARRSGARVVIEFHEVQDTGELGLPLVERYVDALMPRLIALTDAAVIHSESDRLPVGRRHKLGNRPVVVIHHGPYDHHAPVSSIPGDSERNVDAFHLLYFGVIRPFKGVEDLIRAFDMLSVQEAARIRLTVVGETWENWTLPSELIASSRYSDRITFVNRYVSDAELAHFLADADGIALPYHRSSASGPLHTAMSLGLPVIVTTVGGLPEAASGYEGAVFVPPMNPAAIREAIIRTARSRGKRYEDPHSWNHTRQGFSNLFDQIGLTQPSSAIAASKVEEVP